MRVVVCSVSCARTTDCGQTFSYQWAATADSASCGQLHAGSKEVSEIDDRPDCLDIWVDEKAQFSGAMQYSSTVWSSKSLAKSLVQPKCAMSFFWFMFGLSLLHARSVACDSGVTFHVLKRENGCIYPCVRAAVRP